MKFKKQRNNKTQQRSNDERKLNKYKKKIE